MRKFIFKATMAITAMLVFSVALSYKAQSSGGAYTQTVSIIQGKADTIQLKGEVADILVANPSIADVGTLRTDRLYVVGKNIGDTNILAYDDLGNQLGNINVHVRVDDNTIQESLQSFFPSEHITAKTVKDNIVLSGMVSSPSVANQVRDLATRFVNKTNQTVVDLMKVKGEQQVMLRVKILEAKRTALKELGVQTSINSTGNSGFGYEGNNVGLTSTTQFGTGALLIGNNKQWGPISMTLRGLETQGLVNILAEPNLTAISGETAGFLAGGEYPIPTARDLQGNITVEFKPFGVSLNFTPTVLSSKRIALQMSTEVSEIDTTNALTIVSTKINGLSVRRAQTTVELGSGATIMIAGLIKSDSIDNMNGLPGIQSVPILGALFKSKSFQRNESELLIMVTPYLVESYADGDATEAKADSNKLEDQLKENNPDDAGQNTASNKGLIIEEGKAATLTSGTKKVVKMPEAKVAQLYLKKDEDIGVDTPPAKARVIPNSDDGQSNLSKGYINNLRSLYGHHVPQNFNSKVGYIVD